MWAQTPIEAASQQHTTALDCSESPFGRVLEIGGEREIFVGLRNLQRLHALRLDLDGNGLLVAASAPQEVNQADAVEHTATAADLNGDGHSEWFQSYGTPAATYGAVAHQYGMGVDHWLNLFTDSGWVAATGNIDDATTLDEEVVVASRLASGAAHVHFFDGDSVGGIAPDHGAVSGEWRSNEGNRAQIDHISVAAGDLRGDGQDEIVVAFRTEDTQIEIVVLAYEAGYSVGSGDNYASQLKEITYLEMGAQRPMNLQVATGDIDGDHRDEIVLVADNELQDTPGLSDQINIRTFDVNQPEAGGLQIEQRSQLYISIQSFNLGLAVADPARAVDNNLDGHFDQGSVTHTASETHPWWQVDLGQSQPIAKVRVWNRSDSQCEEGPCAARLTNFALFVSEIDPTTLSNNPHLLKQDSRVTAVIVSGTANQVSTFLMLKGGKPVQGRYVRVQLLGNGVLSLAEVQLFGPNHVEPDRYPRWVADANPNDGHFEASIYNPETNTWETVNIRGELAWNGADYNVLADKTIGPGGGAPNWSLSNYTATSSTELTSTSHTGKIGVEIDAAMGVVQKVAFGGGYEFSAGVEQSSARTLSFEKSFEIGGSLAGFPPTVNNEGVLWPTNCQYQMRPYYYWKSEPSDSGYVQRFLVVDYTVPDFALDRTADLADCRNGIYRTLNNSNPLAVGDSFTITSSHSSHVLSVLVNDSDADGDSLTLTSVSTASHGTVTIVSNSLIYTPTPGYSGMDSFTYTVSDGRGGSQTTTVTLTVQGSDDPGLHDDDGDGLTNRQEDLNQDGDWRNDNSDNDAQPNYLDNDDDNDGAPTINEGQGDADQDAIPDYLDNHDNSNTTNPTKRLYMPVIQSA
jgi:hypothetical protein